MGSDKLAEVREVLGMDGLEVAGAEVETEVEEVVGFDRVRGWMEHMFAHFRSRWRASTRLVIDESMFAW